MGLYAKDKTYPNGSKYVEIFYDDQKLGNADEVEGGFLVLWKRKPQPTIQAAAIQMVKDRIAKLDKERCRLNRILSAIK